MDFDGHFRTFSDIAIVGRGGATLLRVGALLVGVPIGPVGWVFPVNL